MLHSTQIFWRCRVAALYTVDRMQSTITSAVRGHVERVVTTDTSRLPHTRKSSKRLRAQVLVLNALSLPEDVSQCIHKSCTGVPKDFAKELLLQHHGMKWCNMCGGCIIYADRCKVTACFVPLRMHFQLLLLYLITLQIKVRNETELIIPVHGLSRPN